MATVTGDTLPPLLMARLGAGRSAHHVAPGSGHTEDFEFTAVPICTIDPDGLPHPAMLSYGEIAADDVRSMRAEVYSASSTARHLSEQGKLALLFVDAEGTYYVKAIVIGRGTAHPTTPGTTVFTLGVVAVLADAVDTSREPDAVITSGIRFTRTNPQRPAPGSSP